MQDLIRTQFSSATLSRVWKPKVRDKFHLHDFSHIVEELLEMGKQPLGALSKLLLVPADIPEFIEDLPDVLTLAKKKT
jgi:hypothetical protein